MMTQIDALINLMQDDDLDVALIAMEKLLAIPEFVNEHLPELQESSEARIRERVHQMESILFRKKDVEDFMARIKEGELSLWDDLVHLNLLVDTRCSKRQMDQELSKLCDEIDLEELNAQTLAKFMREKGFTNSLEDALDEMLFLLVDIFDSRVADSIILSLVAREIGRRFSWDAEIVLHKGHHCLLDRKKFFIDPDNDWKVEQLEETLPFYVCSEKDILLATLTRLYLAALNEGQLKVIHSLSRLMAVLCGGSTDAFPYPIGEMKKENDDEKGCQ